MSAVPLDPHDLAPADLWERLSPHPLDDQCARAHTEHMTTTQTDHRNARLGNGAAVHLTDDQGILCNRWGTVNGVWKAPRSTDEAATCKRCAKLAQA